jgi:hypothetical protein
MQVSPSIRGRKNLGYCSLLSIYGYHSLVTDRTTISIKMRFQVMMAAEIKTVFL